MKFAVDSAHRDFFKNHALIEFEQFFTPEQTERLRLQVKNSVIDRLTKAGTALEKASPAQFFMAGRDLWRSNPLLRKMELLNKLGDIAMDLTEEKSIRLGYDQYFPPTPAHLDKGEKDHPYVQMLFLREATLESLSSIQGLLCGVMICLQEAERPTSSTLFPKKAGNAVYMDARAVVDFSVADGEYLLITYTKPTAVYIFQPQDPHTHALKRLGYVFGDKLADKLHPLLKRG